METIIAEFYSFCFVFITCELGEQLTIAFDELEFVMEQLDWYLFPIEIQRLLPIILISAQQSVTIQCFGSFATNRDTFKKVEQFVRLTLQGANNCVIDVHFRW